MMGKYGFSRTQLQKSATLEAMTVRGDLNIAPKDSGEAVADAYRAATPRQQSPRQVVQHANPHGISPGGIAGELGISRNTVRKYGHAVAPPREQPARGLAKSCTQTLPICVFAEQELTAF